MNEDDFAQMSAYQFSQWKTERLNTMSKLQALTTKEVMQNMQFIRLQLEAMDDVDSATFLVNYINELADQVDRQQRQEAIEARNAANGGYTKASH